MAAMAGHSTCRTIASHDRSGRPLIRLDEAWLLHKPTVYNCRRPLMRRLVTGSNPSTFAARLCVSLTEAGVPRPPNQHECRRSTYSKVVTIVAFQYLSVPLGSSPKRQCPPHTKYEVRSYSHLTVINPQPFSGISAASSICTRMNVHYLL